MPYPIRTIFRVLSAAFVALALFAQPAAAQNEMPAPKGRAILVLDASGSMWGQIEGKNKIVIAREVIGDLMKSWDPDIGLGFVAYGHRVKGDCADIETLVEPGAGGAAKIAEMVSKVSPKGMTPLSAAVRAAAEKLKYTEEAATVILVTDGLETCNMDPCALGKSLEESGVNFTTHVVGFDLKGEDTRAIQCLAESTGGKYLTANNAGELATALGAAVTEVKKSVATDGLRIVLAEGVELPQGDTARFDYFAAGADGKPAGKALAYEYARAGRPALEPGNYIARIQIGAVDAHYAFAVLADRKTEHTVVLNAGVVTFDANLGTELKIDDQTLRWDVFYTDAGGAPTKNGAGYGYGKSQRFILPAENYVVKAQAGAAVRSESFALAPGEITSKTIDMRAGRLRFDAKLTAASGPEKENFAWKVYHADPATGARGEQASYSYGSDGTYTLSAGRYVLAVEFSGVKRDVTVGVEPDKEASTSIDLDAGRVTFGAVLKDGGAAVTGDGIKWEARDAAGKTLTYAYAAAPTFLLPSGPVAIGVSAGRVEKSETIEVRAGETTTHRSVLNAGYVRFSGTAGGASLSGNPRFQAFRVEGGARTGHAVAYDYDQSGSFLLPAGTYEMQLDVGQTKGITRFTLKAGESIDVNVAAP